MIISAVDFSVEELERQISGYDYCIVGAGIVGLGLAITLEAQGRRVLVLETGDWRENPSINDFYCGLASPLHPSPHEYRRQRFGGTSHLWGGRCVPMDSQDFETRSYVPNSGWPISDHMIRPFMGKAHEILDTGEVNYSPESLTYKSSELINGLSHLSPDIVENIERYSLPTDVGHKYRKQLQNSENVLVIMRARVVNLNFDESGLRVISAIALIGSGTQAFNISAMEFVLCGGGLETTRLMLCVRQHQPSWIRFDDVLGKYYGCHYDLISGELQITSGKPRFFFEKTRDGIYARRKLQFSKTYQKNNGLLNAAFRLHFQPYANAKHGSAVLSLIYLAKSILPREHQDILNHGRDVMEDENKLANHLANIAMDFPSIPHFAFDWLFKMKLAKRSLPYTLIAPRSGRYPLDFNSEQEPSLNNKISLLTGRDSQNIPRISVKWSLTERDIESGRQNFIHLRDRLNNSGIAQLNIDFENLQKQLYEARPIGGHHMGTTRMGVNSNKSVVDENLRVHGMQNLRIASASVFPTFGAANPTLTLLTIVLWAFRRG